MTTRNTMRLYLWVMWSPFSSQAPWLQLCRAARHPHVGVERVRFPSHLPSLTGATFREEAFHSDQIRVSRQFARVQGDWVTILMTKDTPLPDMKTSRARYYAHPYLRFQLMMFQLRLGRSSSGNNALPLPTLSSTFEFTYLTLQAKFCGLDTVNHHTRTSIHQRTLVYGLEPLP